MMELEVPGSSPGVNLMNWAPQFLHGVETKEALIQLHVHLKKLWGKKHSISY